MQVTAQDLAKMNMTRDEYKLVCALHRKFIDVSLSADEYATYRELRARIR